MLGKKLYSPIYCFDIILELKGNLIFDNFIFFWIRWRFTPLISKSNVYFFTKKAQYFTTPLPLPILMSWGFFVIGILGEKNSHIFARFFKFFRKTRKNALNCCWTKKLLFSLINPTELNRKKGLDFSLICVFFLLKFLLNLVILGNNIFKHF